MIYNFFILFFNFFYFLAGKALLRHVAKVENLLKTLVENQTPQPEQIKMFPVKSKEALQLLEQNLQEEIFRQQIVSFYFK